MSNVIISILLTLSFAAAHWWGGGRCQKGPFSKICYTYLIMMKLSTGINYLKKIQKAHTSRDTLPSFCWQQHFLPEVSNFCDVKKYWYRLHFNTWFLILLTFFESLKFVLVNMVAIFMMLAKLATLGLLKVREFWNKGYNVIIYYQLVNDLRSETKGPGSSPASTYGQRWAICSNHPANV